MDWFKSIGLNDKQQAAYLYLLKNGVKSASELAKGLGEQRTNSYLIVEELLSKGLVEIDHASKVIRYRAASPDQLQSLMTARQRHIATQALELKKSLPDLNGLYQLTSSESGIAYFEGLKGYTDALEDQIQAGAEVCVFAASELLFDRPDAWEVLLKMLQKRGYAKIKSRILYETAIKERIDLSFRTSEIIKKTMEAKFWGNSLFDGEVAIYKNSVIFTVYDEKLTSILIKNSAVVKTMQTIFNTAWAQAEEPK
jgi:sugar-specific transcriptional regulator TrmB